MQKHTTCREGRHTSQSSKGRRRQNTQCIEPTCAVGCCRVAIEDAEWDMLMAHREVPLVLCLSKPCFVDSKPQLIRVLGAAQAFARGKGGHRGLARKRWAGSMPPQYDWAHQSSPCPAPCGAASDSQQRLPRGRLRCMMVTTHCVCCKEMCHVQGPRNR